ncbi:hypothetical protein K439DRAFT_456139 [Ramaria rubella]|nr:hypothetical protein K439DRAFT_456139 [Ramaria rubella]
MIILDSPSDPQKRRLSSRSASSFSDVDSVRNSHPPSYRSTGSTRSLQPMLDSDPPQSSFPSKPQKADKRFWRVLFYALAVYAVVSIAVAVPYFVIHNKSTTSTTPYQRMKPPDMSGDPVPSGVPVVPVDVPSADGTVLGCNVWDYTHDYGYPNNLQYSRLTYCLPHNSTNIWLHALGGGERFVSGQFTVKLNPDEDEDDYMVDVLLTYNVDDVDARNSSAICLMQDHDKWGVGIYTPPGSLNHSLDYQITLLVPSALGPLTLPQFTTYLPWFSHSFNDLNNTLVFGDVEVSGIASSVDGTIFGETVNVTTSQAAITGNYRASKTLILQTSYAKIDTNITLGSTVGQEYPTSLMMRSSEGPFSATVNLSSSGTNSSSLTSSNMLVGRDTRPQYSTSVTCDDSPVTLIFRHDDSVDFSDLDVQVNTTLNRAVVLLDSKFEGTFDLYSTNGSVIVADLDGNEQDEVGMLSGSFPDSNEYRRSLAYQHDSVSQARGCVKRGEPSTSQDQKVNVKVRNHLALVALGFVNSGDTSPSIVGLGLL